MKYDLIACDYDDTLLPPSKEVSRYSRNVISRYVELGGRFVICSGRMFASIRGVAAELNLHGDAICYQGALTKNLDTGETLDYTEIHPDLAVEYVKFLQNYPVVIQLYADDTLYIEKENPYSTRYAKFCGVTAHAEGNLESFIRRNTSPINKVYCYIPAGQCEFLRNRAIEAFGDRLLINSSKPWNVEAVDIGASKGKAVGALAQRYGISMQKVMTIGDNLNDVDMIECAGLGVAVGNAVDALKLKADYITADDAEDGVAKAIEKFCFGL